MEPIRRAHRNSNELHIYMAVRFHARGGFVGADGAFKVRFSVPGRSLSREREVFFDRRIVSLTPVRTDYKESLRSEALSRRRISPQVISATQ